MISNSKRPLLAVAAVVAPPLVVGWLVIVKLLRILSGKYY